MVSPVKPSRSGWAANSGTLTGSTKYKGVNKLTVEGESDLGELGKAKAGSQKLRDEKWAVRTLELEVTGQASSDDKVK